MKGNTIKGPKGWDWQLKAGNGLLTCSSVQGYETEKKAAHAFDRVFQGLYPLRLTDDSVVEAYLVVEQGEGVASDPSVGSSAHTGGLGPDDPNHPLYSPRTLDGDK